MCITRHKKLIARWAQLKFGTLLMYSCLRPERSSSDPLDTCDSIYCLPTYMTINNHCRGVDMGEVNTDDFGGTVSAYERRRIGYRAGNAVLRCTGAHETFYSPSLWLEKTSVWIFYAVKNVFCHVSRPFIGVLYEWEMWFLQKRKTTPVGRR